MHPQQEEDACWQCDCARAVLTAVAPEQTFFCSAVVDCLAHLVFRSEVIYLGDSLPFLNIEGSERKWTCQKRNHPDVKAMAPAQAGIKVADVAECILIPAAPTQLGTSSELLDAVELEILQRC